jgi:hypothetical protein
MSDSFSPNFARVLELLADQSAGMLSDAEQRELAQLMASLNDRERAAALIEQDRLQNAAAEALALMMSRDREAKVSASLRDRLIASGMAELGSRGTSSASQPETTTRPAGNAAPTSDRPFNFAAALGWLTAAAAIVIAFVVYGSRPQTPPVTPAPTTIALRDELLKQPGTVTAAWSPVAATQIAGDVVWNAQLQKGYLRFKGLPENDPTKEQYQLWIFDKGRIDPDHAGDLLKQNPIDGGVFDIAAAQKDPVTGDYIVPIDAKLKVFDPGAFAVTAERPGGVVVTSRQTIQALAPVGG